MTAPLSQHQQEIQRNLAAWESKPILRQIYASFYRRILALVDPSLPGRVVEVGSGIGNLKAYLPGAVCTDLFPNPWLDLSCDGYELPFAKGSISHLVLFDVFHHLQWPTAFFKEARRVLTSRGRVIVFDPFISLLSRPVYGLLHHEPIASKQPIDDLEKPPAERAYYAAQGNATRLFFGREVSKWPTGWEIFYAEAFSCVGYLLSGGYSKPAFYPSVCLSLWHWVDAILSRWPRCWAGRCLVGLRSL